MANPILYRRRIIPEECVLLKDDIILSCDEEHIVTSWHALHPKKDLHHGSSCYFLKEGFKVSKFCRENGSLLYWYCDIVDYDFHPYDNHLIVTDLLADVIIYPDGFVKVVDLDELVTALDARSIDINTLKSSLVRLDKLLKIIYSGKFDSLQKYIP
ncbi:MAG: DUF402 domain-containing protein [Lachnospiraceae bacterium]|nr:DUF402 domain-containing protein [Lachnospiraceae bacterium]GFI02366.1 hypothetical protein IMSAGC005_01195 [Lachnospiraceae bacterium]